MSEQKLVSQMCSLPRICPKIKLEKMGVKFLSDIDDLLIAAVLPIGWRKQETINPMWSELYNEKNQKIASIFYKSIDYDRYAFLRLEPVNLGDQK